METIPEASESSSPEPADRYVGWATVAVLTLLAVPLVVALISVSRETWYPTGDMAQAELHVSGFFSHPPLVGAAGRIGNFLEPYGQGSHPGPAMWVALLPAYLLTGRSSFGLQLGMTALQLAFIVPTVFVVRRLIGPLGGLLTALVAAVLVYSLGPEPFLEPWNPWGALFAFFCFVALCWGITCGRYRWLPAAAFCGFFALQCHTGYALLVGAGLAAVAAYMAVQWGRERTFGIVRSGLIAAGVSAVMWLPPIIDQLRREPGNLRILWRYFSASSDPDGTPRQYVGLPTAVKAFAGELALPGPWIRGDFRQPTDPINVAGLILAVVLVGVAVVLLVRQRAARQRSELIRLFILLGGFTIVGIGSTSRVFDDFFGYVVRWWWILVGWTFLATALVLIRRVRSEMVVGGAVALAVLVSGFATANALGHQNSFPRHSRLVGGIDAAVAPHLDPDARYLIRWHDPATLGGVPFGVVDDLEKRGFHVGVDATNSASALPHRVLPEASAGAVLWIVLGEANIDAMRARGDATELGSFDQRSAAQVAESDRLREQLIGRLTELGVTCLIPALDQQYGLSSFSFVSGALPPDVARIAGAYNELGLPIAIFELPPLVPPFESPPVTC